MPNAKDLAFDNYFLKMLIYGKPGSGKTSFCGTFPRPYVFDFDQGIIVLKGLDVEYDNFSPDPRQASATIQTFLGKIPELYRRVKAGEIQTIILDSYSTLADLLMAKAMSERSANEAKNADPNKPIPGEWYEVQNLLVNYTNMLKGFPCHLICLAHEDPKFDEKDGSEKESYPLIAGKLGKRIGALFDEQYRAEIAPGSPPRYILRSAPRFPWLMNKSRIAASLAREGKKYPVEMIPDFQKIMTFVQSETKAEPPATPAGEPIQ